jgi:phosphoglycerate dehydrogenase-like enzyme
LVTCGRGTASDEIADYVIAAIYRRAKDLEAARVRSAAEWRHQPLGRVIGSTVGIIGLARSVRKWRGGLWRWAPMVAVRRIGRGGDARGCYLVGQCRGGGAGRPYRDAVPATAQTHHMFNAQLLARTKPGAHLINAARGSVVDQEALLAALDGGRLDFATLDVTEPEPCPTGTGSTRIRACC